MATRARIRPRLTERRDRTVRMIGRHRCRGRAAEAARTGAGRGDRPLPRAGREPSCYRSEMSREIRVIRPSILLRHASRPGPTERISAWRLSGVGPICRGTISSRQAICSARRRSARWRIRPGRPAETPRLDLRLVKRLPADNLSTRSNRLDRRPTSRFQRIRGRFGRSDRSAEGLVSARYTPLAGQAKPPGVKW